jgi:quercetin dioxygenase-like cupin family protein
MKNSMKTLCQLIICILVLPGITFAQTMRDMDKGPDHHLQYLRGDIEWQSAPASLESNLKIAVLEGNPSQDGVFTLRIMIPEGGYISPHWHPNVERVTVISGTFLLGSGEEMDINGTERLEAGSYTSMPPGMRHYAMTEGGTVIQLTSVGPWEINYVNPDRDDPRKRTR